MVVGAHASQRSPDLRADYAEVISLNGELRCQCWKTASDKKTQT